MRMVFTEQTHNWGQTDAKTDAHKPEPVFQFLDREN